MNIPEYVIKLRKLLKLRLSNKNELQESIHTDMDNLIDCLPPK